MREQAGVRAPDRESEALPDEVVSVLDALVRDMGDAVAVYGEGGRLRYRSPASAHLLRCLPPASPGTLANVHPDDRDRVLSAFRDWMAGSRRPVEFRALGVDGGWRSLVAHGTDLRDHPVVRGLVVTTREASGGAPDTRLLDPVTGLASRPAFFDRMAQALARARRQRTSVGVLTVDVDRFSSVNAALGYRAGDRVLHKAGQTLRDAVRPEDTVARLGGDRFVICCEDLHGTEAANAVALRVQEAFASPLAVNGHDVHLSVTVGVAVAHGGQGTTESLLAAADAALADARLDGGARSVADAGSRAPRPVDMEQALRRAIDRGELHVAYQPIVNLVTGRAWGTEALLRWHSPDRGTVPPSEFVPVAEDSGLIVPLGAWVLTQACAQTAAWRRLPGLRDLTASVNVSARQLLHRDFAETVAGALAAHDLPPSALCLEITETTAMGDRPAVAETTEALTALGVGMAIDDFGIGYSSLLYLKRFPAEQLKVDRSFVSGLEHHGDDESIVRAVVGLAHGLGVRAVAEGVETPAQLDALAAMGCDLAQGYLWSRAVAADQLTSWLVANAAPARTRPARRPRPRASASTKEPAPAA